MWAPQAPPEIGNMCSKHDVELLGAMLGGLLKDFRKYLKTMGSLYEFSKI